MAFEATGEQAILEAELALEARTMLAGERTASSSSDWRRRHGRSPSGSATGSWRSPPTPAAVMLRSSLAWTSLDLLLLTAKRHLRRRGVFSSEALRQPARDLDAREAATFDGLLDELEAAGTPGFGPVSASA